MAFEQTFKNIDNKLRTDEGCGSELDYVEQSSWILFLKYLDDLEETRKASALLQGEEYTGIIDAPYRWSIWAMPKDAEGNYDRSNALVGDDLIEFVNRKLFPYLAKFKEVATAGSIESKIGVIFSELRNKIQSGYNLRDIIEQVNELKFQTSEDKHEMSALYESRLSRMGNAGRNGGEYYTPRPLIRTIVKVVNPEIGQTVYDGACGSAGFLCEAYNYMHQQVKKTDDEKILQTSSFYGKEVKSLAYIIAIMNMILHGVESPDIRKMNTLNENLANVQPSDQFDCILANPPFGGKERPEVQQNFPIKTSETAYLFLQHFIKYLKAGGKAGIVIKNTFLSNTDNASISLRKKLLADCNLHTVLDLPAGVFQAGVKTVILFFKKGEPTRKVWYYQLNLDRTLGKTNPLNENDLAEFVSMQRTQQCGPDSWILDVADLGDTCDLSAKNPNKVEEVDDRTPESIIAEIKALNSANSDLLDQLLKELK
jgi:type I restriction enzyme M protein